MISPPAAAYPFPHNSTGTDTNTYYRPFKPPSDVGIPGATEGTRYVWGDDTNGDGTLGNAGDNNTIFPNIPPRPGPLGEIPMLPGDFTKPTTSTNNNDQMSNSRPNSADKTLWYRTAGSDGNWPGEGDNIAYDSRNLFLNQLSFPQIGGGAGSLKANLSTTGSLVLPNTACINLTDGMVDDRCTTKSYKFGENGTYTLGSTTTAVEPAGTTLLNLNLPYNPHFPSDNTSAANITSSSQPASSFVVCGGTGNNRNYQAIERPLLSKTDISGGSCAQAANTAGEAIRNFVGTITTTTTAGSGSSPDTTNLTGGTGLLSFNLLPSNAAFVGLNPDSSKKNDITQISSLGTTAGSTIDVALRAVNTYANNKVHVYNIGSLGTLDGGTRNLTGKITFRANCVTVDPTTGVDSPSQCTPTSVRRGPSPVFIMRGNYQESINFKGLQVKLDGVDPNNIFWVSSRTQKRLPATTSSGNFVLSPSNGKDPIIAVGQRIVFTPNGTDPVPPPLTANTTYYILTNNGGSGNSSKITLSATPPPAGVDCSVNNPPASCPPEISGNLAGSLSFAVSAEPSFIFEGSLTNPNILTGNFLGNTTPQPNTIPFSEDDTSVFAVRNKYSSFRGVRFLGLYGNSPKINSETLFVAMTAVDEPALLPVLQLHVPDATGGSGNINQPNVNSGTVSGFNGVPDTTKGQWTIRPTKTEVNVYLVGGSSPSRNGVPYTTSSTIYTTVSSGANISTGETGGGLANFVRFLENWDSVPVKITGGFIQNTRSRFATAPYTPASLSTGVSDLTSMFMNPAQPGTGQTNGLIASGYNLQYMSKTVNRIPYYTPPLRLWGYDVGLLTQQPDRFAERFAIPIAGSNEFFREVSSDDPWVESLLCALEPDDPVANRTGTAPTNYRRRVLRGSDARSACSSKPAYGGTANTGGTVPVTYN